MYKIFALLIGMMVYTAQVNAQSSCEQIMDNSDEIKELVVESITSKNTYEIERYLTEALELMNSTMDLVSDCDCDGVYAQIEDMIGETKWAIQSKEWEEQREVAEKLEDWCYDLKRKAKKCGK
jgi:hypothetical protein